MTPNVISLAGYPVQPAYPTGYSRAACPEGPGSSSCEAQAAAIRGAFSKNSKSFPFLKIRRLFWRTFHQRWVHWSLSHLPHCSPARRTSKGSPLLNAYSKAPRPWRTPLAPYSRVFLGIAK